MTSSTQMGDTFTQVTNIFIDAFSSYTHQLMSWGTWLFVTLATINLGWLALGYLVEKDLPASMLDFLKRFFIMMFFYTVMTNPDWLLSIAASFTQMGEKLTGIPLDPSSVMVYGILLSDKISQSIKSTNILHDLYGVIFVGCINMVVMFCFFSIGLRLACTLIINTALVVVSAFFLGFGGLGATSEIARTCITTILANCARLFGIYLVVGAGAGAISNIAATIPSTFTGSFDAYSELAGISLFLWYLAKELPEQFARLISHHLNDVRGVDALAGGFTAMRVAQSVVPGARVAVSAITTAARTAGSIVNNGKAHFSVNQAEGIGTASIKAITGAAVDTTRHAAGTLSDHIKQAGTKLAGGQRVPATSFSTRMYHSAETTTQSGSSTKPASS